jgi:RNA polymerase sigma factor (sigma-70 family)
VGRGMSGIATPTRIVTEPVAADDNQLVAAVRRGDDRAFEALYSRYCRRIHAYVMGMVKDHGRAEDITQEVFVSALRRMRETERPIAFKPWVYEIAKNACIDQFRRSRRAEEVSLQADDGLAPSDYGRLVGSDPAPDDAVAAKQELDNLCGAFGGLSDTHHEILVLRELEGLSYREIGDRMGMSRPAVESTLFRARRRLTEEYDELVSGARCVRIQNLIATATSSRLGTREQRRLSRHVAYCQTCRREALAAGLDSAILTHVPLRKRAAAKVAALLPFPIFTRWRGGGGDGPGFIAQAGLFSDQLSGGWAKLATAAAVLVAGLGAAEVGTKVAGGHDSTAAPKRVATQGAAAKSGARGTPAKVSTEGAPAKTTAASKRTQRRGAARRGARRHSHAGTRATSSTGTPTTTATGGGGGSRGGGAALGSVGGGGGSKVPAVTLPAATGQDPIAPLKNAADAVVTPVVEQVTGTVQHAAQPVIKAVEDAGPKVPDTPGVPIPPLP